jgi:hypothetical protein
MELKQCLFCYLLAQKEIPYPGFQDFDKRINRLVLRKVFVNMEIIKIFLCCASQESFYLEGEVHIDVIRNLLTAYVCDECYIYFNRLVEQEGRGSLLEGLVWPKVPVTKPDSLMVLCLRRIKTMRNQLIFKEYLDVMLPGDVKPMEDVEPMEDCLKLCFFSF